MDVNAELGIAGEIRVADIVYWILVSIYNTNRFLRLYSHHKVRHVTWAEKEANGGMITLKMLRADCKVLTNLLNRGSADT